MKEPSEQSALRSLSSQRKGETGSPSWRGEHPSVQQVVLNVTLGKSMIFREWFTTFVFNGTAPHYKCCQALYATLPVRNAVSCIFTWVQSSL